MNIEEIRQSLVPHKVEGFTYFCVPMPTLKQTNWLISEHDRLTKLVSDLEFSNRAADRTALRHVEEIDRLTAELAASKEEVEEWKTAAKEIAGQWEQQAITERSRAKAAEQKLVESTQVGVVSALLEENKKLRAQLTAQTALAERYREALGEVAEWVTDKRMWLRVEAIIQGEGTTLAAQGEEGE